MRPTSFYAITKPVSLREFRARVFCSACPHRIAPGNLGGFDRRARRAFCEECALKLDLLRSPAV